MKIVSSAQMREIEKIAIEEYGIPEILLMENAAFEVYKRCIIELNKENSITTVIVGNGNNGGDGFAVARHLFLNGYNVNIVVLGKESNYKKEALINYNIVKKFGIEINIYSEISEKEFNNLILISDLIVDAIFGTGLKGEMPEEYKKSIDTVNSFARKIISIDIPSGVNSDTGEVCTTAIKADETVTLGYYKKGLFLYPACLYTGKVILANISIPEIGESKIKFDSEIYTDEDFKQYLPERTERSNKGTYGSTFVFAGSFEMPGAAVLAAKSAYKIGSGLVYGCFIEEVAEAVKSHLIETVLKIVPGSKGHYNLQSYFKVNEDLKDAKAVIIGPGIGVNVHVESFLKELFKNLSVPCVIDADALNILAENLDLLNELKPRCVITPHPGEMSRLTNLSIEEILKDPIKTAINFSKTFGVITVLKDMRTIVASPEGNIFINTSGNNSLSKGGSGDVLTGIIAGLIAQGADPFAAAKLGVYIHGKTGEMAGEKLSNYSVNASDLIEYIPKVLN